MVAHLREFGEFVEVARFDGSLVATRPLHPDWESFLATTIPTLHFALPDPPPYGEGDLTVLLEVEPRDSMDPEGARIEFECITGWPEFEKPRQISECDGVVISVVFDSRDVWVYSGPSNPCGGRLTEDVCLLVARPAVAERLMQSESGRFRELAPAELAPEWVSFLAAARLRWSPWLSSD
jgi:hypothetical protein